MKKNELKKSNLKVRIYVVVFVSILLLLLTSYGYFYITKNQSDRNRLTGACFNTSFTDGDSINIESALPLSEDEGQKTSPYHFTLTNSCAKKIKYYVILNVKDNSFSTDLTRLSINGGYSQKLSTMPVNTMEGTIDTGYSESYLLKTGMLEQSNVTETIRIWLDESLTYSDVSSLTNKSITAKIKIVARVAPEYNLATTKILNIVDGESTSSTDVITKTAPDGATCTNTLAYDGTVDNNLRYVGANPCNYITFNGENAAWRIIGVFNNIDNGTGKKETRLKLVRNLAIGSFSWDSSENNINTGYGINDWTQADLMKELNDVYTDNSVNENQMWYSGQNNAKSGIYYANDSLKTSAQSQIDNVVWNLGSNNSVEVTPSVFYNHERSTHTFSTFYDCNDGFCPRKDKWTGKVALIYPSDYGFAVGGSYRSTCLARKLSGYSYTNCSNNDWIKAFGWTLTHYARFGYFTIDVSAGLVNSMYSSFSYQARPTVYLNSSMQITGGSGTPDDPYTLG